MRCPICCAVESVPVAHPDYRQCRACRTVFQASQREHVADYYASIDQAPDFRRQIGSYRTYLRRISDVVGDVSRHALIDVGGADGLFARMAEAALRPRQIAVVETSETARSVLRERGIPILAGDAIARVERKIVVALQVLEHVPDPVSFIDSFGLKLGDFLVLTSPAVDAPYFRFYGRRWRSYAPSHHLILYSREGLCALFRRTGLTMLHYEHVVSGVHCLADELMRFIVRVALWPIRRKVQFFHGKASFLVIGTIQKPGAPF